MKIVKDKSFGTIPVYEDPEKGLLFCLVQHGGEHWGFPKGHPEEGEAAEETARRELEEETGIKEMEIVSSKSFTHQYFFDRGDVRYDKSVKYFIGMVSGIRTEIPEDFQHEISGIKCLPYKEARELTTYENAKVVLDEANAYLESLN